ncbi:thioredoxin [Candidatus Gottesmanbacteria bacterium]|nr:thioredoxin [Candidatus Gottesmanbacteria bacterium]
MSGIIFTDANFEAEVLKSDLPVLVDFYADWCGPCKMIAPIVEELAKEYKGKLKVGELDVDTSTETAQKYGVMSIPTLIIFKGGQVVSTLVGFRPKEALAAEINKILQ